MAKKTSIINVVVAGDSKPLRKALGKAGKSLGNFSKQIGKFALAGGAAMTGVGIKAIDLAVDFEEALSKSQQIFGGVASNIELSANKAADAVGMSKTEFLDAASTFGVFGKAGGLTGVELSKFSDAMVKTAADVASFNNLRPEEAVEKLAAGLRGSMEPLQSVGVLMNADAVKAEALAMGLIEVGDKMTEGQKIMARHSLIMQQLGEQGAMGDFARTSDGLANKQRILTARIKNLGIELGTVLLPIAEKLASGLEALIGKFEEWSPAIRNSIESIKDFLAPVGELARKWFPFLGAKIADFVIETGWPAITKAFEATRDFIKNELIPRFAAVVSYLKKKLPEAGQAFIDHINRNKTKYTLLAGAITGLAVAFGLLVIKAKVGAVVASLYGLAGGVKALTLALSVGLGFFAFVGAMAALYATSEKFRNIANGFFTEFIDGANDWLNIFKKIKEIMEWIIDFNLSDHIPDEVKNPLKWADDNLLGPITGQLIDPLGGLRSGLEGLLGFGGSSAPSDEAALGMPFVNNFEPTSTARNNGTTINVNMPAGSDGQDVVAALQRYARNNGAPDVRTSNLVVI